MTEPYQTNRTWLCSVLFIDIVDYSSRSVELQLKLKERFNQYLGEAIRNVPENERVIIDTGDGAAICFLGGPEAAMFAAFEFRQFLLPDASAEHLGLRVRIGINLGPVRLVRDINGAPNALGDGINVGQRIMSFAAENQILVSQSYFEVVSRLSDDYKVLFSLKGVGRDKHIREHTLYALSPPGVVPANAGQQSVTDRSPEALAIDPALYPQSVGPTAMPVPGAIAAKMGSHRMQPLVAGLVLVLVLIVAAGVWTFFRPARLSTAPGDKEAASSTNTNRGSISKSGVGFLFDPPSNVRLSPSPSARILCSVQTKQTINLLNFDGAWYATDVCGAIGYVHRSQIRFSQ